MRPRGQALDCLTPLGRGQTLLVTGEAGAGKSALCLDAILGQFRSGVRCVYAAIGLRWARGLLHISQDMHSMAPLACRAGVPYQA